jgi:hypothetical protein
MGSASWTIDMGLGDLVSALGRTTTERHMHGVEVVDKRHFAAPTNRVASSRPRRRRHMLYFFLFETGRKGVGKYTCGETDNVLGNGVFRLSDSGARDHLCDSHPRYDVYL